MADPGILSSQLPAGEDFLVRRVADIERAVREMRAADILRTAGLVAALNKLTVVGELDVTGPMVVGGTLSLPAGIIDNAALANPVKCVSNLVQVTNFGLTTIAQQYASLTFTIPVGFTTATVFATSSSVVYSATGTTGTKITTELYLTDGSAVDTDYEYGTHSGTVGVGCVTKNRDQTIFTSISGGTSFTISWMASGSVANPANASNQVWLKAVVIYTR